MYVFMHIMLEFYLLVHLILETSNLESNLIFEYKIGIKLKTEIRKKKIKLTSFLGQNTFLDPISRAAHYSYAARTQPTPRWPILGTHSLP